MNNKDIFAITIIVTILGTFVGALCSAMVQINKLQKENEKLNQEIIDYEWQIAQVPYVIESSLNSWCNGE